MPKLARLLPLAAALSLVVASTTQAQVQPVQPESHHDLLSGAAIAPDLEAPAPGPSSPTSVGRPPRVGPNEQVNAPQQAPPNGLLGRSETTVAATDDGQFLVAGFNDAQGFCGAPFGSPCTPESPPGLSGFSFSTDAGLTWIDGGAPSVINHVFTRGDPWLDRGGLDGATFFYANLAVHDVTGHSLGVSIHRGHFSGSSFAWEDVRTVAPPNPSDSYDKEAIAAAKDLSGTAYVSLTNFIATCGVPANGFGQIEVWRTHDSGISWQGPVVVSPDQTTADPTCGSSGVLQQSSVPAIGPNGELFVVWQHGPTFTNGVLSTDAEIVVARSLDGGVTFSAPARIAAINSMRQDPPVGYNRGRINDHPRIAVATSGPQRGRVYVSFSSPLNPVGAAPQVTCPAGTRSTQRCFGQNLTSSQAFVAFSDDGGQTWSTPVAVAPAVPATGIKRLWPVVSVEPGGVVNLVYYESQETSAGPGTACNVALGGGLRRTGPASSLVDTFWVRSTNGVQTWEAPLKLTSATSNWCTARSSIRPNFGDYIGAVSGGNRVLAATADGRNGVPDTFFESGLGASRAP